MIFGFKAQKAKKKMNFCWMGLKMIYIDESVDIPKQGETVMNVVFLVFFCLRIIDWQIFYLAAHLYPFFKRPTRLAYHEHGLNNHIRIIVMTLIAITNNKMHTGYLHKNVRIIDFNMMYNIPDHYTKQTSRKWILIIMKVIFLEHLISNW